MPLTRAERYVPLDVFPPGVEEMLQEHLLWWEVQRSNRTVRLERRYETLDANGGHSNYYVKAIVDAHRQTWYFSKTELRWRKVG